MFVSYSPPCHSDKLVDKLILSLHVKLLECTDLEKTKSEFFITLCNPKFCSKALKLCFVSKLCLHFCALYQGLAQSGSFETRQLKHGEE